jgi:hypothetical protein
MGNACGRARTEELGVVARPERRVAQHFPRALEPQKVAVLLLTSRRLLLLLLLLHRRLTRGRGAVCRHDLVGVLLLGALQEGAPYLLRRRVAPHAQRCVVRPAAQPAASHKQVRMPIIVAAIAAARSNSGAPRDPDLGTSAIAS